MFLLSSHWARHLYHLDGVHMLKHTVTAAVLRTPKNETHLLDEENCCILYVLIFIQGLKLHCLFSYYLRENDDVRGLIGTVRVCLLNWEFNIHCHQQNCHCYYLSCLQSLHFLSLLRILKIDINVIFWFTLNIRSLFLWLFLTRFFKISIREFYIPPL